MSLRNQKKKTWSVMSKYIRLKYSNDNGYCTCYTCGVTKFWKDGMQAGHLLDGRNNSILFEEDVIRVQCTGCNMFKAGLKEIFIPKYIDENGREKYDTLVRQKNKTLKYSTDDLKLMEDVYNNEVKSMLKEKGLT